MKNPLETHKNHQNRINEIFGKISKFFSSLAPESDRDIMYKANLVKGQIKLLDPNTCDRKSFISEPEEERDNKNKKNQKKKLKKPVKSARIGLLPSGGIIIDSNKIINNYSELFIENLVRGTGMGSFRKLNVRDLVCYDLNKIFMVLLGF